MKPVYFATCVTDFFLRCFHCVVQLLKIQNQFLKTKKSWRDLSILYAIRYFTYVIYLRRLTIITATNITMTASKTPRIYPTNSPVEIFSGGFTMTADSPETK